MNVAIMYSGVKNDEIYKKSLESLKNNLFHDKNIIKYDVYEYFEDIEIKNKYKKYEGGQTGVRTETITPMFYKIYMCNKKINLNYDVLIRIRFDFILKSKINLFEIDLDKYNIPNYGTCLDKKNNLVSVCDFFCISNQEKMNHYCKLYENLDKLFEISRCKNPECLLCEHLGGEKNISLWDIDHHILRTNGKEDKFWFGARYLP